MGRLRNVSDLTKLIVGAAVFAVVMFAGVLYVANHPVGPISRLVADSPPQTTNPETTASGSEPVWASQCAFAENQRLGAVCTLFLRNVAGGNNGGGFLGRNLTVDVPAAWLRQFPHPTQPNNVLVIAGLIRTANAPAGDGALRTMAISVDPSYGELLHSVNVTPQQFLAWLYQRVPNRYRPPWVKANPAAGN